YKRTTRRSNDVSRVVLAALKATRSTQRVHSDFGSPMPMSNSAALPLAHAQMQMKVTSAPMQIKNPIAMTKRMIAVSIDSHASPIRTENTASWVSTHTPVVQAPRWCALPRLIRRSPIEQTKNNLIGPPKCTVFSGRVLESLFLLSVLFKITLAKSSVYAAFNRKC
ncbi:hypothetical protein, partial [Diaphorobacter ruginosibacter]|uniref:hypothetical protein n=1 Tax=Diaphorobacter ruginosibacter TaxID=1715720 RepID=UPI003342010A